MPRKPKKDGTAYRAPVRLQKQLDLTLPPARIEKCLRHKKLAGRSISKAGVAFLTGATEALLREILAESLAIIGQDQRRKSVLLKPRDILMLLKTDDNWNSAFDAYVKSSGNQVPSVAYAPVTVTIPGKNKKKTGGKKKKTSKKKASKKKVVEETSSESESEYESGSDSGSQSDEY